MANLTFDISDVARMFDQASAVPKQVIADAFATFQGITPVRSGNARNNTRLTGMTIEADYQYAQVLDAGRGFRDGQMRGSNQAPDGMSTPTQQTIRTSLQRNLSRIK